MRAWIRPFLLLVVFFSLLGYFIFARCRMAICLEVKGHLMLLVEELDIRSSIAQWRKKVIPKIKFDAEDTLVMHNGSMIQGVIDDKLSTPDETYIRIDGGLVSFRKEEIAEIRRGETLVEDESGIQTINVAESEMPYPRIYLKNGNIVYGSDITRDEDSFYIKQAIEGGGAISYGFKIPEIERIRLWPPPKQNLPMRFRVLQKSNFKMSSEEPPYVIISSVESSDALIYFNALQRVYEESLMLFFEFIDLNKPHDAFPVIIFGDYNQFLSYAGLPKGTNIQGFYVPRNRTLHLYNVREIDYVQFQLGRARAAKQMLGQAMTQIELGNFGTGSGKWAAYDRVQKVGHEIEKQEMKMEHIARIKTIQTVRHEALHQFMHYLGRGGEKGYRGAWFSEGIAMYLEPEDIGAVNQDRLMYLRYEMDEGFNYMPLQYLMSFRGGADVHKLGGDYTLAAYAQSWAFVYYLMKNHKDGFFRYMHELRNQPKGFNSDQDIQLLQKHIGMSLAEMTAEYEPLINHLMKTRINEEDYFDYRFFQKQAAE